MWAVGLGPVFTDNRARSLCCPYHWHSELQEMPGPRAQAPAPSPVGDQYRPREHVESLARDLDHPAGSGQLAPWLHPCPLRFGSQVSSSGSVLIGHGFQSGEAGGRDPAPLRAALGLAQLRLGLLLSLVLFHMYDSDSDGRITLEEYRNVKYAPAPHPGLRAPPLPSHLARGARSPYVSAPPGRWWRNCSLETPTSRRSLHAPLLMGP